MSGTTAPTGADPGLQSEMQQISQEQQQNMVDTYKWTTQMSEATTTLKAYGDEAMDSAKQRPQV